MDARWGEADAEGVEVEEGGAVMEREAQGEALGLALGEAVALGVEEALGLGRAGEEVGRVGVGVKAAAEAVAPPPPPLCSS